MKVQTPTIRLTKDTNKAVEIIRTGHFTLDPVRGELAIEEENIDSMVSNFDGPGRLAVSWNHGGHLPDPDQGAAAGWIEGLFSMNKSAPTRYSLMGHVSWTEKAKEKIEAREWAYISAEIIMSDQDVETGQYIGMRCAGASLCNHPAIPNMDPVELTRGVQMKPDADQFWNLVNQRIATGLSQTQARHQVMREHPSYGKMYTSFHRGGEKNPYADIFYSRSYEVHGEHPSWTLLKCRGEVQRRWPALYRAAFNSEPLRRFQGAMEYESETMSMPEAEAKAARLLPDEALRVQLLGRMR